MRRRAGRPERPGKRNVAENRRARYEYELLERWEAGIVLTGSEVKSVRAGTVNLGDSYVRVTRGEAWLLNCHVGPYVHATVAPHDPLRRRKLLLHGAEIESMGRAVQASGLTLVPTRLYFAGSRVKLEIALARGKKLHDKRETIKKRDEARHARAGLDR